jgi:hypothetical protein
MGISNLHRDQGAIKQTRVRVLAFYGQRKPWPETLLQDERFKPALRFSTEGEQLLRASALWGRVGALPHSLY